MQNIMGNNMLIAAEAKADYVNSNIKNCQLGASNQGSVLSTASGRQTKQAANRLTQVAPWQSTSVP